MSDPGDQNVNPYNPPKPEPQGEKPPPESKVVETDKDARTWGMMSHLSALLSAIMTGFLGGFIGPLIIWLIKKDSSEFVNDQGKEALNFQLTLLIGYVIAYGITLVSCGFLFFVLFVPIILQIIFAIIAAIKANEGVYYRYPFNIRMIS